MLCLAVPDSGDVSFFPGQLLLPVSSVSIGRLRKAAICQVHSSRVFSDLLTLPMVIATSSISIVLLNPIRTSILIT